MSTTENVDWKPLGLEIQALLTVWYEYELKRTP
jgi:hypothetical protein